MSDQPFVENDDMPFVHNPIRALPWIDSGTEVEVFQLRPTLHNRLAEWCSGEVVVTERGLGVRIPGTPPQTAQLGDFVVRAADVFTVESADGFFLRFWPKGRDPGWSHRCFMNWESP